MKSQEELIVFYNDVLAPKLLEMEALRKATRRKTSRFILICVAAIVSIIGYCIATNDLAPFIVPLVLIGPFTAFVLYVIWIQLGENYELKFKKEIVGRLVKFYDNRLTYSPEKGILASAMKISQLFTYVKDEWGTDYVEGQVGETFIQFSKTRAGDHDFSGIFMIASFNKYFKGSYMAVPRKYSLYDKIFNKIFSEVDDEILAPIKLENPDFEKEFTYFGQNEVEARYIMTPSFMEKMLDFRKKVDNDLYVSFTRSRMFLAFGTEEPSDIFEPSLKHETSLSEIEEWGNALQLAIGMVEEFGLNTRIWSKA